MAAAGGARNLHGRFETNGFLKEIASLQEMSISLKETTGMLRDISQKQVVPPGGRVMQARP